MQPPGQSDEPKQLSLAAGVLQGTTLAAAGCEGPMQLRCPSRHSSRDMGQEMGCICRPCPGCLCHQGTRVYSLAAPNLCGVQMNVFVVCISTGCGNVLLRRFAKNFLLLRGRDGQVKRSIKFGGYLGLEAATMGYIKRCNQPTTKGAIISQLTCMWAGDRPKPLKVFLLPDEV